MQTDRYGLGLTTASDAAADAYREGVDLLLSANVGATDRFERALSRDPRFALASAALGRAHQLHGRGAAARAAIAAAEASAGAASERERSHVAALALLVAGRGPDALAAARNHLARHPRDAMILAPCTGVFGLIGFSGHVGREAELAKWLDALAVHYGDDWWFAAAHAFALVETGRLGTARPRLERSMQQRPRNANAAHINAHLLYEEGQSDEGIAFLERWLDEYPREGVLHCHLNWHRALFLRETGRVDEAWRVYRDNVRPGATWGPPLNMLTDSASFLWLESLGGATIEPAEWTAVATSVPSVVEGPGVAFADVHALLAFAAAAETGRFDHWQARIESLLDEGRFAAGAIVPRLGAAFRAFIDRDYAASASGLRAHLVEHERIGGSRAQRDLIEHTLVAANLRRGLSVEEAVREVRARVQASHRAMGG